MNFIWFLYTLSFADFIFNWKADLFAASRVLYLVHDALVFSSEAISLCTLTGAAAWIESVPPDLLKEPFLSPPLSDCPCGQKTPDDVQLLCSCETFFSPAELFLSSLSLSASRYVRLLPSLEQPDITFFRPTKYFLFLFPPQTASTDEFFCQKLQLRFDLRRISPRQGLLIEVRKYTFRLCFYKFGYNLIIFSEENTSRCWEASGPLVFPPGLLTSISDRWLSAANRTGARNTALYSKPPDFASVGCYTILESCACFTDCVCCP